MSILFDVDPLTQTVQRFHWDPVTEKFTITDDQEVQDLLDMNQALRNTMVGHDKKSGMHRVASVPLNIYMKLKAEGIIDDKKRLKAWLNDPDNRAWRTNNWRI